MARFAAQERRKSARQQANNLQSKANRLEARGVNKVLSSGLALNGSSIDQLTSMLSGYAYQAERHLIEAERKNAQDDIVRQYDNVRSFLPLLDHLF